MFITFRTSLSSLNAVNGAEVVKFINALVSGDSVPLALASMTNPSLILQETITQVGSSTGWTLDNGVLSSPCVDSAKVKQVRITALASSFTVSALHNNVMQKETSVTTNTSKNLWFVVRVTPRSFFIGTYDSAADDTSYGVLISEYDTSKEAAAVGNNAGVLPVTFMFLASSSWASNSVSRASIMFLSNFWIEGSNTYSSGYGCHMILGDCLLPNTTPAATTTYALGEQYESSGSLIDFLLPFGVAVPPVVGAAFTRGLRASVTDMCGIYFHQGIGRDTSRALSPPDIVDIGGVDYIFFRNFAIPMN